MHGPSTQFDRSQFNKDNQIRPSRSAHIVRVNVAELEKFLAEQGVVISHEAIAEYLGLGYGTVRRLRNGEIAGAGVVAALAKKIPAKVPLQRFLICGVRDERQSRVAA